MSEVTVPAPRTEALVQKLLEATNHAAMMLTVSLGHRTGLFDAMAGLPPATSGQIAEAAGLSERYVREWLGAMVTAGVVEYDPQQRLYTLPADHAAVLTRSATPNNMASLAQWIAVLGSAEDRVVEAFQHGQGVPYCHYHRFHQVMAEESEQTTVAALQEHILPLVPGLIDRLRDGITVLDVGCGSGRAMIELARLYPASRFVGYDLCPEAVERAREAAAAFGLANVRFEVRDAAALDVWEAFDLVTAFDAIHDQAAPAAVLRNIARALRRGGTFLMQDIDASSHLEKNLDHPLGTFLYTISCMHCMSVSLAGNGAGLGAVWGRELALRMLRDAGFGPTAVHRLPHDMINCYYVTSV